MKSVSCTIVTYNSESTIRGCLESLCLQKLNDITLFVHIVDNNSEDKTVNIAKEFLDSLNISITKKDNNSGFSGGHNTGFSLAISSKADYSLVLNPDIFLLPEAIYQMTLPFHNPQVFCVSPKLYRTQHTEFNNLHKEKEISLLDRKLDACGMYFTKYWRHFDRGADLKDTNAKFNFPEKVIGASGACVMIRTDYLPHVSFSNDVPMEVYDNNFFAYREDADLSMRSIMQGFTTVYTPYAKALHIRSQSTTARKDNSKNVNAWSVRNRFLMSWNNFFLPYSIVFFPHGVIRDIIVILGSLLFERHSLKCLIQALLNGKFSPKKRLLNKSRAKISFFEFSDYIFNSHLERPFLLQQRNNLKQQPSLTCVVVTYNQSNDLEICIRSLLNLNTENISQLNIVVVNNNPEDQATLAILEKYKNSSEVSILTNTENLGFAKGVNKGFESSTADYLLILNPDLVLEPDILDYLLEPFNKYAHVGAVGPCLDGTSKNKYIPKRHPRLSSLFASLLGIKDHKLLGSYSSSLCNTNSMTVVEQLAGACICISREAFSAVDGLSEKYYPAWFEDVELGRSLARKGFTSVYLQNVRVRHEGGTSVSSLTSNEFLNIFYGNSILYWIRNEPRYLNKLLGILLIYLTYCSRFVISSVNNKHFAPSVWYKFTINCIKKILHDESAFQIRRY